MDRAKFRQYRRDSIEFLHRIMMDEHEHFENRQRAATNLLQQLTAQERTERGIAGDAERFNEQARRSRYA